MSEPPNPRFSVVELLDEECIVQHGAQRSQWFVREADSWVRASRMPNANCTRLEAKPGTVWQTRIEITAELGTRLMRVESRPAGGPPRDAFAHLTSAARGPARRVTRSYFRVGRAGRLVSDNSNEKRR
jgi:hypothetical protein